MQLVSILEMILVLNAVIFVHELGHYLFYRRCGVAIRTFSIGFGPVLWRRRIGDTDFCFSAILIGGYVMPMDMVLVEVGSGEDQERLQRERPGLFEQSNWISNKGPGTRFVGAFAGPFFNYLFAILAGTVMFLNMERIPVNGSPVVQTVTVGSAAEKAGVHVGDTLIAVNGTRVDSMSAGINLLHKAISGSDLSVTVLREDAELTLNGFVVRNPDQTVKPIFGVLLGAPGYIEDPGVWQSFVESVRTVCSITSQQIQWFGKLFVGKSDVKEVSSVVGIVSIGSKVIQDGLLALLSLLLMLNVAIGFINLIPFPPLDGSHMLLAVLEALRGKPIGTRAQLVLRTAGLVFLVSLMLLGLYNDIIRISGT